MIDVSAPEEAPEMVTLAVAGDRAAFGAIYEQHYGLVFRFIFRRVSNRTLAEDLAADVFLRALRRCGSFVWQGTDIAAWLLAIARNRVADHYRSPLYLKERLGFGTHEDEHVSDDFEARPEDIVIDHMMIKDVTRLLPELSAEQQEVLTLRFVHDLTLLETAEKVGRTEGAVKALQYRAVRALARAWYAEQEKQRAGR